METRERVIKLKKINMTKQEFEKFSFKFNMAIDYIIPRTRTRVECLLISVNFDTGILEVEVIDYKYETNRENRTTHVHYDYCEKPFNSIKLLKKT